MDWDLDTVMRMVGSPHNRENIDHRDYLVWTADALSLGDRLFQKRLTALTQVDGFVDAALLVAEASV